MFPRMFRKARFSRPPEAVFEAHVEITERDRHLGQDDTQIEAAVVRTLVSDLPRDLERIFGLEVSIRVKATRYGSLSVFFAAVVAGYGLLSGYRDIYGSIELIRQQADDLLGSVLRQFGSFNVSVYSRYPERPDTFWDRWRHHPFYPEMPPLVLPVPESAVPRRDGFFYFLLAATVLLFVVVAVLVYGAVTRTYFQ